MTFQNLDNLIVLAAPVLFGLCPYAPKNLFVRFIGKVKPYWKL